MQGKKIRPQFISVPFKADGPNGVTEYNGIAKFSRAGIVVEFDSKYFGLISGEVKEVKVALEEILDIRFRKGIYKFFAQIQFRLRNFTTISELPNHDGKVKLKIKREDFELAQGAVEQTLGYMNDLLRQDSADFYNQLDQLPPVQTSVNELIDTEKLSTEDSRETNKLHKNTN